MRLPDFPTTSTPRDMPRLREALASFMLNAVWVEQEQLRNLQSLVGALGQPQFDADGNLVIHGPNYLAPEDIPAALNRAQQSAINSVYWYVRQLPKAQLIHVSDDLARVMAEGAAHVPDDHILHAELLPTEIGLVQFAQPIWGTDSLNDESVRVDGFLWAPAMLPPQDQGLMYNEGVAHTTKAISMAAFRMMRPEMAKDPRDNGARQWYASHDPFKGKPFWMPLGRSDWLLDQRLDEPPHVSVDVNSLAWKSMKEDRQLMSSLWALLQQRRLVERRKVEVREPKPKYRKQVKQRPAETVHVVHLRRAEYTGPTGEGRKVNVTYHVRGFWRRQAYGPGRTKRRLVYIGPHWRGSGPVKSVENIWSLDR